MRAARAAPRADLRRLLAPPAGDAEAERYPDMLFVAEAYWDLVWALQQQGFDYCYDKRLYDRLVGGGAPSVRAHLGADPAYQRRLVRFLENHDEPRAAGTLSPPVFLAR